MSKMKSTAIDFDEACRVFHGVLQEEVDRVYLEFAVRMKALGLPKTLTVTSRHVGPPMLVELRMAGPLFSAYPMLEDDIRKAVEHLTTANPHLFSRVEWGRHCAAQASSGETLRHATNATYAEVMRARRQGLV